MTLDMIDKWNKQVNNDDVVYHLGDLCLGTYVQTIEVLEELKGKIILIKGNHDYSKYYKKIIQKNLLHEYHEIGTTLKYNKQQMWLTHYPFEIGLRPGKWSICAHVHHNETTWDNQINVGIDSPHFKHKPFGELITINEVYEVMMKRLPDIERRYLNQKWNR